MKKPFFLLLVIAYAHSIFTMGERCARDMSREKDSWVSCCIGLCNVEEGYKAVILRAQSRGDAQQEEIYSKKLGDHLMDDPCCSKTGEQLMIGGCRTIMCPIMGVLSLVRMLTNAFMLPCSAEENEKE